MCPKSHINHEALDLVRRIKAYQAHVAGKPNQDRFIELCDELFAVLRRDDWHHLHGLPMSAIKVGMKLRSTTNSTFPIITVTEITDKGFKYTHPRHYWTQFAGWSEGGECYGQDGYSFYELDDTPVVPLVTFKEG